MLTTGALLTSPLIYRQRFYSGHGSRSTPGFRAHGVSGGHICVTPWRLAHRTDPPPNGSSGKDGAKSIRAFRVSASRYLRRSNPDSIEGLSPAEVAEAIRQAIPGTAGDADTEED
jgi:hypothetical protein